MFCCNLNLCSIKLMSNNIPSWNMKFTRSLVKEYWDFLHSKWKNQIIISRSGEILMESIRKWGFLFYILLEGDGREVRIRREKERFHKSIKSKSLSNWSKFSVDLLLAICLPLCERIENIDVVLSACTTYVQNSSNTTFVRTQYNSLIQGV